jgi:anti-sigma-K factor RskA
MNAMNHDSTNHDRTNDELLDLLTERALGTLSPTDATRLRELLDEAGLNDIDDMDLAAAAAMNAFANADDGVEKTPKPAGLEDKLRADAERFFASEDAPTGENAPVELDAARARRAARPATASSWSGLIGWAVAATLAVVVVAIALRSGPQPELLDPAAARAALMADEGTTVVGWNRSEIPAYRGVAGDVVWNDERQEGFLRLTGMPANDPGISQYQLWIVDPERDENPVDGGVFDIPGNGEVIIPIRAKLDVSDPEAFAITREQPGGVVVSDGPLLVVAPS